MRNTSCIIAVALSLAGSANVAMAQEPDNSKAR